MSETAAAELDLFGQPIEQAQTPPPRVARKPVPEPRQTVDLRVPFRPCTITKIDRNTCLLVNDDVRSLLC